MPGDTLAQPVIELSVNADKLRGDLKDILAETEKTGKAAETSFKNLANLGIGRAVQLSKQFNTQLQEGIKNQKRFTMSFVESLKKSNETFIDQMKKRIDFQKLGQ